MRGTRVILIIVGVLGVLVGLGLAGDIRSPITIAARIECDGTAKAVPRGRRDVLPRKAVEHP